MSEQAPENEQDGLRPVTLRVEAKLAVSPRLKGKIRLGGSKGRPGVEEDSRDEVDRDTGRMTRREQFFDRQNDYWEETVTYKDTGGGQFQEERALSEKHKPK